MAEEKIPTSAPKKRYYRKPMQRKTAQVSGASSVANASKQKSDTATIIACCGLVCSKCGMFLKQKCHGCLGDKPMFATCPIKPCNKEKKYSTCAQCKEYKDLKDCKKLYNWISRIIGFVFRTNRIANLNRIRKIGMDKFKKENS